MFILSDPLIVAHHAFCMASLVISAAIQEFGGLGFLVLGTCALEAGTVWYNFNSLFGRNKAVKRTYWIISTVSNLVATGFACWFCTLPGYPLAARAWYLATVIGLVLGRQREMILDFLEDRKSKAKQK